MSDEVILGIDLGTATSCVAVVQNDKPVVIANRGHLTTPSVVGVAEGDKMVVGHAAKRQAVTNAANTVAAIKRLIGRHWDSAEVKSFPHPGLVQGPNGDVRIKLRDKVFALAELNALILEDLKAAAEAHLGHDVHKCVITVPAYFNDGQRQATRDAARIAGLEVVRIINEPTAAAVAYGFGRGANKTVVVYDLGGGTFDISIVRVSQGGTFEVLGTGGDTYLGGEDFDMAVLRHLTRAFEDQHGMGVPSDRTVLQRLKEAAEEAKRTLSGSAVANIELPLLARSPNGEPINFQCTIDRPTFDALCKPLVDRTITLIHEALAAAKLRVQDIDDLLLVGGSSRVPMVHLAVTELLGRKPSQGVHPDEAVATGAAIHAFALGGGGRGVTLLDVTPYTLGIEIPGNRRVPILPKLSRVPTSVTQTFSTSRDNQAAVDVVVLQGESDNARENTLLARFHLPNIRQAPAGHVTIDVTIAVNESGVVEVFAKDVETGRVESIQVLASSGLTEQDVQEMRAARIFGESGKRAPAPAPARPPASGPRPFPQQPKPTPAPPPLPPEQRNSSPKPPPVAPSERPTSAPPAGHPAAAAERAPSERPTTPAPVDPSLAAQAIPVRALRPAATPAHGAVRPKVAVKNVSKTPAQPPVEPVATPVAPEAAASPPAQSRPSRAPKRSKSLRPSKSPKASGSPAAISGFDFDMPPLDALPPPEELGTPPAPTPVEPPPEAPTKTKLKLKGGGGAAFQGQLEEVSASLEYVTKSATKVLASTDYGRGTLDECQLAIAKARDAIATGDGQAMRDMAFELARIEQTIAGLTS
jgi:molecular chaperone DnaK